MSPEDEIKALKEINRELTRNIAKKCDEINSLILANDNLRSKYDMALRKIQDLEMKLYSFEKNTSGLLN
jgi:hypothetical protein